jgi:hypothetical protein
MALERFLRLTGLRVEPRANGGAEHGDTRVVGRDGPPIPLSMRRLAAPTRYLLESSIVHAAAEQRLGGPSLVLLSVSKLVPKMLDRIDALLGTTPVNAAVISDAGGAWIRLPDCGLNLVEKDAPGRITASADRERRFEFPDASAWILKVLLLSRLRKHPRWWGGYRGPIRTGAELAERAGVSPSMVSHVFDLLRSRSWLHAERLDEIAISRPRALLEMWLSQARHRTLRSIPVRPLYGTVPGQAGDILHWLAGKGHQPQGNATWAVSGWMACSLHETGFVTDLDQRRVSIACLGDHQPLIAAWDLMRCEERDAMFVIQPSLLPRSITGGIAHIPLGGSPVIVPSLPVVDVIQAAMDVAADPARGFEQAEHICKIVVEEIGG